MHSIQRRKKNATSWSSRVWEEAAHGFSLGLPLPRKQWHSSVSLCVFVHDPHVRTYSYIHIHIPWLSRKQCKCFRTVCGVIFGWYCRMKVITSRLHRGRKKWTISLKGSLDFNKSKNNYHCRFELWTDGDKKVAKSCIQTPGAKLMSMVYR